MSSDWIKMRMNLQTHPKVVRMVSALNADKFRVVGGLHAVWSVFDEHSEDGLLEGYTLELMDQIVGWPGFSEAMQAIGWLDVIHGEGIEMPRFDEHNGKSAKRRANDSERKRNARKSDESPENVRTQSGQMSACQADKKTTREEKNKTPPTPRKRVKGFDAAAYPIPDWLPAESWQEWVKFRRETKHPLTETTCSKQIQQLWRWRADGHKPGEILDQSVRNGWQGLFEPKGGARPNGQLSPPPSIAAGVYD